VWASGADPAHGRTWRTRAHAVSRLFLHKAAGRLVASVCRVIWFFEKEADLLVCEIRRPADDQPGYEFEIADSTGPTTLKFDSPKELIAKYLTEQSRLIAEGWRPRSGNVTALE
jgi:hypothetical protein